MTQSAVPFRPTQDKTVSPTGYPSSCFLCGRHASGIGLNNQAGGDPHFICEQCWPMIEYVKSISNFNGYERAAVAGAVAAVEPFIDRLGPDLSQWQEEDAEAFVRAVWTACGSELRRVIKEGTIPF